MREIRGILAEKAEIIDKTLKEIMCIKDPVSETLYEAMNYTLFSGGKRIRPILTLIVAEMIGGNIEAAARVGSAIELIHTYSLLHDDLPSMDNDDYRRGKPTNHRVYGPGIAVLAGDGLLTYAFNVLSSINLPPEKILKIINIVSETAGINGMVGGQVLDLEAEDRELQLDEMIFIHKNKTGALFRSSILAGAYCGNPSGLEIKALTDYANYLGLTFQIVDDILDITGDEEKLGKSTGRDQDLNKATYPSLIGLEESRKRAEKAADKAKECLGIFGERAELMQDLATFLVSRQS